MNESEARARLNASYDRMDFIHAELRDLEKRRRELKAELSELVADQRRLERELREPR